MEFSLRDILSLAALLSSLLTLAFMAGRYLTDIREIKGALSAIGLSLGDVRDRLAKVEGTCKARSEC